MVFIPYKYVYNVNITDIEKPTQSFYAYSHSMIFVIPFNLKKTNKFYLIKSHKAIKILIGEGFVYLLFLLLSKYM